MSVRHVFWAALLTSSTAILGCGDVAVVPADAGSPCTSPDPCDDMNSCTKDACEGGFCVHKPILYGDLAEQTPWDCRRRVCVDGVEASRIDSTDVEPDGNECTLDTCTADGAPAYTEAPLLTPCTIAGVPGFCDWSATCKASDCIGSPWKCDDLNPCTADGCNSATGLCDYIPLDGVLTPGFKQVAADCRVHLCVAGSDSSVVDDTDLPVSANDCVAPVCTAGVPSQPPASMGTACTTNNGKVCDGNGTCVACNVDADCIAPQTCTGNPKICQ